MSNLTIELLNDSHNRDAFRCGQIPLDEFLKRYAGQFERRNLGRTYVLVSAPDPKILGYYTLAAGAIPFESLPKARAKKLPSKLPVPAILLGRLAVDETEQKKGYGSMLLYSAWKKSVHISQSIGAYALMVSALDESAVSFYVHHGFTSFENQERFLFMPIESITPLIEEGANSGQ